MIINPFLRNWIIFSIDLQVLWCVCERVQSHVYIYECDFSEENGIVESITYDTVYTVINFTICTQVKNISGWLRIRLISAGLEPEAVGYPRRTVYKMIRCYEWLFILLLVVQLLYNLVISARPLIADLDSCSNKVQLWTLSN